jgi:hypothetical protein
MDSDMKSPLVVGIATLSLLLLAYACGGRGGQTRTPQSDVAAGSGSDSSATAAAGFKGNVQPLFDKKCASSSCHGAQKSAGIQLSAGTAYDNIVNVKSSEEPQFMRIKPGVPDSSYIVIKLEGRQKVGMRMPLTGGTFSDKEIQAIRSWISAGAKND